MSRRFRQSSPTPAPRPSFRPAPERTGGMTTRLRTGMGGNDARSHELQKLYAFMHSRDGPKVWEWKIDPYPSRKNLLEICTFFIMATPETLRDQEDLPMLRPDHLGEDLYKFFKMSLECPLNLDCLRSLRKDASLAPSSWFTVLQMLNWFGDEIEIAEAAQAQAGPEVPAAADTTTFDDVVDENGKVDPKRNALLATSCLLHNVDKQEVISLSVEHKLVALREQIDAIVEERMELRSKMEQFDAKKGLVSESHAERKAATAKKQKAVSKLQKLQADLAKLQSERDRVEAERDDLSHQFQAQTAKSEYIQGRLRHHKLRDIPHLVQVQNDLTTMNQFITRIQDEAHGVAQQAHAMLDDCAEKSASLELLVDNVNSHLEKILTTDPELATEFPDLRRRFQLNADNIQLYLRKDSAMSQKPPLVLPDPSEVAALVQRLQSRAAKEQEFQNNHHELVLVSKRANVTAAEKAVEELTQKISLMKVQSAKIREEAVAVEALDEGVVEAEEECQRLRDGVFATAADDATSTIKSLAKIDASLKAVTTQSKDKTNTANSKRLLHTPEEKGRVKSRRFFSPPEDKENHGPQ
eukprot:NODE_585_length_1948_cov_51.120590_g468_i0.p1 GENE.NODE_585_length_1948_cov_51.120590_g468_i0~~NODE_585_length_1948_cov_51.120590_g468_i0.p1  ORF type:complete len:582 (-),score=173.21 NODE_585_length_1948_cov_51.120590_g468_i0:123-1868(-)